MPTFYYLVMSVSGATMMLLLLLLMGIIPLIFKDINNDNICTNSQLHTTIAGNCSYYSLVGSLVNITRGVTMHITNDNVLSSVIQLAHLATIGYNNPTVQCSYSGGLHFVPCHNVTTEGIIWNKCGVNVNITATQRTGLYNYNSSNIIF